MTTAITMPTPRGLLTATELGAKMRHRTSGVWLNRLLTDAFKWQVKHAWQGYIPTGRGLAFGHVVEKTWRDRSNNAPRTSRALKWSPACVDELQRLISMGGYE